MIMATIIKRTDSLTELPLTTASRRSLPPRGSREAADNFCRKMKFAEFFQARGNHEMRRLNGFYQKTSGAPHHRLPAEPPPKGKPRTAADNFCRKK